MPEESTNSLNLDIASNIQEQNAQLEHAKHFTVEYIWIGGGEELRSKTRTLPSKYHLPHTISADDIPEWNYDGSSTGQASGRDSEVVIIPRSIYKCPFRGDGNYMVMCDTYHPDGKPLKGNNRVHACNTFMKNFEERPWYGMEQEYFLLDPMNERPIGFPKITQHFLRPQGQYYCSVGVENAFGRTVVEEHYQKCLQAGITVSGINAEVAPGPWEFQVGPCEGIKAGDQLWMARYILMRVAEKAGVQVSFEPKPLKEDWNGSGCHTNFSTEKMRAEGGLPEIEVAIGKLSKRHMEHMRVYGSGNEERMTGEHETAKFDEFTYGIGSRNTSTRIPNATQFHKKGYFEDRRPSSNCDPYLVTSIIMESVSTD